MSGRTLPAIEPKSIEELVELGNYCERLMMDDTFNRLTEMFYGSAFTHWVSTKPDDKSGREAIYAPVEGLQQFLSQMMTLVQAKNKYLNEDNTLPDGGDEEFSADGE